MSRHSGNEPPEHEVPVPVETIGEAGDDTAADDLARERQEALQDFWVLVKRIPTYSRLAASLAKDPEVPHRARAMLVVGGAYMVSPIDLVPGVIPVAGQLDDAYVMLMALRQALRLSPNDVADRHLQRLGIDLNTLDYDLAAIRRLVKVGAASGARWGRRRFDALRTRVGDAIANRRKGHV